VSDFAREPNGGLIATASASAVAKRELIVSLAARHRLPAVYFNRDFVSSGGLVSYGADFTEMYRRAASYVDRILKGENSRPHRAFVVARPRRRGNRMRKPFAAAHESGSGTKRTWACPD
jgi:ABC-type uncharacterized transport system substrate-binding protein